MKNKIKITSGIYAIKNKINDKIYIGSSNNIIKRWNEHKNDLKQNKHHSARLQKSYIKYGIENFEFSVLEEVQNIHELFKLEQQYLDEYKPFKRNIGYNISKTAIGPTGVIRNDLRNFNINNKSKKVYQYNLEGVFLKEWNSISEASKFLKLSNSKICMVCSDRRKSCGGFIWKYKDKL